MRTRWEAGIYMRLSSTVYLEGLLDAKRMSGAELADLVGCSRQTISLLRTGKMRTCSPELARKIEQVLLPGGEDVTRLFVEKQEPGARRRPYRSKRVVARSETVRGAEDTAA